MSDNEPTDALQISSVSPAAPCLVQHLDYLECYSTHHDEAVVINMAVRTGNRPPAISHSLLSDEVLAKVKAREEEEKQV